MKPYSRTPLRGKLTPYSRTPLRGQTPAQSGGKIQQCENCGRTYRGKPGTCSRSCATVTAHANIDLAKQMSNFDRALNYEHTITSGNYYSPGYLMTIGRVRSTWQAERFFKALDLTERAEYDKLRDKWRVS